MMPMFLKMILKEEVAQRSLESQESLDSKKKEIETV